MNVLHAEVIKLKDGVISLAGLNYHYGYKWRKYTAILWDCKRTLADAPKKRVLFPEELSS